MVASLKLVWFQQSHPFESDILCTIIKHAYYIINILYSIRAITNGLEPGWLGTSFGLRTSYVRIIITRYEQLKYILFKLIRNHLIWNILFLHQSVSKYKKELLWNHSYILKGVYLTCAFVLHMNPNRN